MTAVITSKTSLGSKVNLVKNKFFNRWGKQLCHFAMRTVDTHVGSDLSRFSRSSNVTRLARLWAAGGERGSREADKEEEGGGGGMRGEAGG